VLEHLLSKLDALSSNPSVAKKESYYYISNNIYIVTISEGERERECELI
jgi:hypothetical protein